jgi:pilus assembly protein CpaE
MNATTKTALRAVIAGEGNGRRDEFRQGALSEGLACDSSDCVSLADLPVRLSRGAADLVLVQLTGSAGFDALRYAAAHTAAPVLAVGPTHDSQAILQAVRSGAREYLDEARFRTELPAALEKLRQVGAVQSRQGRTLAVTAAQAGSGVTTLAANLAFNLAGKHPGQVVLGEFVAAAPSLALALDLEPRHSVADFAAAWQRFDATMMRHTLAAHPDGVQVLAYPPETLNPAAVEPAAVRQAIILWRTLFDWAILDVGTGGTAADAALALADTVLVVTRLEVPALRLTRQLLRRLGEQGVPAARVRLVANRCGQWHQVHPAEAEKMLGQPLLERVPDAPAAVNRALNQGRPLVRVSWQWAPINRSLARLAARLDGAGR